MYFGDSRSIGSKVLHTVLLSAAFLSSLCQAGPIPHPTATPSNGYENEAQRPDVAMTSLPRRQAELFPRNEVEITITTDGKVITTKVMAGKVYTVGEQHGQTSMHTSTVVTKQITSHVVSTQYVLPTVPTGGGGGATYSYGEGGALTGSWFDASASVDYSSLWYFTGYECDMKIIQSKELSFDSVVSRLNQQIATAHFGWVSTNKHLFVTKIPYTTSLVGYCSGAGQALVVNSVYYKLATLTARAVARTEVKTMRTIVTENTVRVTTWEKIQLTVYEGKTEVITKKGVATQTLPGQVLTKGLTEVYTPPYSPESVFVYGSSTTHSGVYDNVGHHRKHHKKPTIPAVLSTTTAEGPFSYTTTVSTQTTFLVGTNGLTTPKKIFHVDTPALPTTISTVTSPGPYEYTTTVSTQSTYVVGSNGMTTPEKIYHVDTPSVALLNSTTTSPGPYEYTTTVSTQSTYVVGSNGMTTPEKIYHVDTPSVALLNSTTTSPGPYEYTTTVSTQSTYVVGTNGMTTPEKIYHVDTPSVALLNSTTTSPGPYEYTTTVSTQSTYVVGTNGMTTPEKIYHVDTPSVALLNSTTTTAGPYEYTTTVSTQSTYVVGSNGMTTPEKIYHVDTPSVALLNSTTTSPGPYEYTTTVSTQSTYVVGSNGMTTPEKIYHVDTPSVALLNSTTTTAGPYEYTTTVSTQSTYVVGSNGMTTPEKIYHVDTPSISDSNWTTTAGSIRVHYDSFHTEHLCCWQQRHDYSREDLPCGHAIGCTSELDDHIARSIRVHYDSFHTEHLCCW